MPDAHLVSYIKKELAAGTDESELISHLRSLNWPNENIYTALRTAKGYHQEPVSPTHHTPHHPGTHQIHLTRSQESRISLAALILIQCAVGLEWLVSFLVKLLSPDYPSEFSRQVQELSTKSPLHFVTDFLNNAIIPNSSMFAYLLEFTEGLIGAAMVIVAVLAYIKGGYNEDLRRPLVASLLAGVFISLSSFLTQGLPTVPSFGAYAADLFIALVQLILLSVFLAHIRINIKNS